MSDRQTIAFTTPTGNTVVLRAYLTGREAAEIKAVQYSAVKLTMSDAASKKFDAPTVSGASVVDKELKEVEMLLVSINDNTHTPFDTLLSLPASEYEAVRVEVEKLLDPTTPEKPAQPGSDTSQTAH